MSKVVQAVGTTKSRTKQVIDLMNLLCPDDTGPVSAEDAARMIVAELLSDLPPRRQERIKEAIEFWAEELILELS